MEFKCNFLLRIFKNVIKNFAIDQRCEIHQTLLGIREGKEGWLEIFCPGGISCEDNGKLFIIMLEKLIGCCCKKKRFLLSINKLLPKILELANQEVPCAIEVDKIFYTYRCFIIMFYKGYIKVYLNLDIMRYARFRWT